MKGTQPEYNSQTNSAKSRLPYRVTSNQAKNHKANYLCVYVFKTISHNRFSGLENSGLPQLKCVLCPSPLSLNSSHLSLERVHKTTSAHREPVQACSVAPRCHSRGSAGGERAALERISLDTIRHSTVNPTADERRHISKCVFLTLHREFK